MNHIVIFPTNGNRTPPCYVYIMFEVTRVRTINGRYLYQGLATIKAFLIVNKEIIQ